MVPLAIKKKKTFVAKEVRLAQRTYGRAWQGLSEMKKANKDTLCSGEESMVLKLKKL